VRGERTHRYATNTNQNIKQSSEKHFNAGIFSCRLSNFLSKEKVSSSDNLESGISACSSHQSQCVAPWQYEDQPYKKCETHKQQPVTVISEPDISPQKWDLLGTNVSTLKFCLM
jgi:hypothetical protein